MFHLAAIIRDYIWLYEILLSKIKHSMYVKIFCFVMPCDLIEMCRRLKRPC
jgi:hypothetical protein